MGMTDSLKMILKDLENQRKVLDVKIDGVKKLMAIMDGTSSKSDQRRRAALTLSSEKLSHTKPKKMEMFMLTKEFYQEVRTFFDRTKNEPIKLSTLIKELFSLLENAPMTKEEVINQIDALRISGALQKHGHRLVFDETVDPFKESK